jgi:hypothetical protein
MDAFLRDFLSLESLKKRRDEIVSFRTSLPILSEINSESPPSAPERPPAFPDTVDCDDTNVIAKNLSDKLPDWEALPEIVKYVRELIRHKAFNEFKEAYSQLCEYAREEKVPEFVSPPESEQQKCQWLTTKRNALREEVEHYQRRVADLRTRIEDGERQQDSLRRFFEATRARLHECRELVPPPAPP